jgi:hypothetical protein
MWIITIIVIELVIDRTIEEQGETGKSIGVLNSDASYVALNMDINLHISKQEIIGGIRNTAWNWNSLTYTVRLVNEVHLYGLNIELDRVRS